MFTFPLAIHQQCTPNIILNGVSHAFECQTNRKVCNNRLWWFRIIINLKLNFQNPLCLSEIISLTFFNIERERERKNYFTLHSIIIIESANDYYYYINMLHCISIELWMCIAFPINENWPTWTIFLLSSLFQNEWTINRKDKNDTIICV